MVTRKKSLKRAEEIGQDRDCHLDLDLPNDIFLMEAFRHTPSSYGHKIANKIMHDCNGVLIRCEPDFGDFASFSYNADIINRLLNYEAKSTYLCLKTNSFRLVHLRDYQDFDYFIICLIDRSDEFKGHYYILKKSFICDNVELFNITAMNNTKKANQNNLNIDKAFTIKREDAFYLFGNNNLLSDTSYSCLIETIKNYKLHEISNTSEKMKITKIAFDLDGICIKGETNQESLIRFVNYIGPLRAQKYFSPFWLSTEPSDLRYIRLQLGNHYLDPFLSQTDATRVINRGNKKTGLDVKLIWNKEV